MKKTRMEKGITLIALIITIIILLILAVVTIGSIKDSGIITYAQNAATDYEKGKTEEQTILDSYIEQIEDFQKNWKDNGNGTFTSKNGVTVSIGDYVDYKADSANDYVLYKKYSGTTEDQTIKQETLQWRVLGINNTGNLELISAAVPEKGYAKFKGATGYNNAVFLLNDICKKQYSNSDLGIIARSINMEDIEKTLNSTGLDVRDTYGGYCKYGETYSFENGDNLYPTLYEKEKGFGINGVIREGGISSSNPYYNSIEELSLAYDENGTELSLSQTIATDNEGNSVPLNVKYTYSNIKENSSYFKSEKYLDLIFLPLDSYWLASRYTVCNSENAGFGIQRVYFNEINGVALLTSNTNYKGDMYSSLIRPIVTIENNVSIITNGEPNSETNMWILSKTK